jgi:hypothetical protein
MIYKAIINTLTLDTTICYIEKGWLLRERPLLSIEILHRLFLGIIDLEHLLQLSNTE